MTLFKPFNKPTPSALRNLLDYDKSNGKLRWRNPTARQTKEWFDGTKQSRGYRGVRIGKTKYYVHAVAWAIVKGKWPKGIDHIDHDKANNKWTNLRAATPQQNAYHRSRNRNNSTGVRGVTKFDNKRWRGSKPFRAVIAVDGRLIHLGLFATITEAAKVRRQAELQYYGEFA